YSPEQLKSTADMELSMGLNLFVIHSSVHQPLSDKIPGLCLGPYGQWFNRHETWAEQATPWITYLARSSYMLQQGNFVADIIYYYGEDNNITSLFGVQSPNIPANYNYDYINADGLVKVLSFDKGYLTTPGGTNYRILALDNNSRYMTIPVLKKIRDLVIKGAVVVGPKPLASPSLKDNQSEFKIISDQLWPSEKGNKNTGKGIIYSGYSIAEVLNEMQLLPDFDYTKVDEKTNLLFVHRKMPDTDIYWINNRNNRPENLTAAFRITGKAAEIWCPVTGKMNKVSYTIEDKYTKVPLNLEPNDAVFVVFREKTKAHSLILPEISEKIITSVSGPWEIEFQSDRGAPPKIILDDLASWSENNDPGVRYFSGTGAYLKSVFIDKQWFEDDKQIIIDLGIVKNLAEIIINGKSHGIVWKKPFKLDVTDALKPGENRLEIRITNLWVNRLIGDQQPDIIDKYTYTAQTFYYADSPLLLSGLLGPVRFLSLSTN
ncbi:MAG: glycoside hydrolase, partial [Bacteroidales bacterium]|nr:glycoside hydrolase [Bacteroidales bacterium]